MKAPADARGHHKSAIVMGVSARTAAKVGGSPHNRGPRYLTAVNRCGSGPFGMPMTPALKSSCLDALVAATSEVSQTVLGGAGCAPVDTEVGFGAGHGAYLSLTTSEEPIQVGVVVAPEGCQLLAKALLGMMEEDEDLPSGDVSDAMCEIINMVAGGLKRRVSGELAVTLGLPIFVAGHPLPNQHQEVSSCSVRIGDTAVKLILLTQDKAAAPLSRRSSNMRAAAKEQSI